MASFTQSQYDSERYNRQSYSIGRDVMTKLSEAKVLVIGYNTLGQEIVKNLALLGVNQIDIFNNKILENYQTTGLYYKINDTTIPLELVRKLNPTISINQVNILDEDDEFQNKKIKGYNLVIITNTTYEDSRNLDRICHKLSIPFIMTGCYGLMGYVFNDFGKSFIVNDMDGEVYEDLILIEIDGKTLTFRDKHELSEKDYLIVKTIDNQEFEIQVKKTNTPFVIKLFNDFGFKKDSIKNIIKKKITTELKFSTLNDNYKTIEAVIADYSVDLNRANDLHELHKAYDKYINQQGETPRSWSISDFEIFKTCIDNYESASSEFKLLAKKFCFTLRGDVLPFVSIIASVCSQEGLKALGHKYMPIKQWYYLDYYDLISNKEIESFDSNAPTNYRTGNKYEGLVNVFGKELVDKIQKTVPFIVGSGAIGCELVKNLGMLGVKNILLTDNDRIEKSNLSRQFLFNDSDIYKSKARTAGNKVKEFNPDTNVIVFENKVCVETENIFTDDFYSNIDVLLNALDNVDARIYMDSKAIQYNKPIIDSGTMGTSGNVQVIIPHLTESYGSAKDPEEKKGFAICTIKAFPYKPEHTIQWARELFESAFNLIPCLIEKYRDISILIETNPGDIKTFYKYIYMYKNWESSPAGYVQILSSIFHENFVQNVNEMYWDYADSNNVNKKEVKPGDRLPTHLNINDQMLEQFMTHGFNILNQMFKTNYNYQASNSTGIQPIKFEMDMDKIIVDSVLNEITEIMSKIPTIYKVDFEKDDESLGHVQFITECANLRNEQYQIPKSDFYTTRKLAGNIIPAVITTTSLVSGFQIMEYIKIIKMYKYNKYLDSSNDSDIDVYRNRFINLNINYIDGPNPAKPQTTICPNGIKISVWSKFKVSSDITSKVLEQIEQALATKITFLTSGSETIFDGDDIYSDKINFTNEVVGVITINEQDIPININYKM